MCGLASDPKEALLSFKLELVNLKLRFELFNLHASVQTEVAVETPHASIKQLIEVDVAIVALDPHLEQYFFHLVISGLRWQADRQRKLPEEVDQLLFSEFDAATLGGSEEDPGLEEDVLVVLVLLDRVVRRNVVQIELLDDNQNKQIQHHVLNHQHEDYVKGGRQRNATVLVGSATRQSLVAVVDEHIPVFTRCNHEQQKEALPEVIEVPEFIDHVASLDLRKEEHCQNREYEQCKHQQQEHIG